PGHRPARRHGLLRAVPERSGRRGAGAVRGRRRAEPLPEGDRPAPGAGRGHRERGLMLGFPRTAPARPADPEPAAAPERHDADWEVRAGGRRLGELLVESRLVSPAEVTSALERMRRGAAQRLGRLLLDGGALSEADLTAVLARQHRLETIDLRSATPDPEALRLISDATAHRLQALPLAVEGGTVVTAVADGTPAAADAVRAAMGRPVAFRLAAQSELRRAIDTS